MSQVQTFPLPLNANNGVRAFYTNNTQKSLTWFLEQLQTSFKFSHYVNLAFISSFYANNEQRLWVLENLDKKIEKNLHTEKLICSLSIALEVTPSRFHEKYYKKHILPNIKKTKNKPIIFFHIPKCGGTTLTKALVKQHYNNQESLLPKYFEFHLLKHCISQEPELFPFLSSQHMPISVLDCDISKFHSITILREPYKRVISSFKQTLASNLNGRSGEIIPKYGSFWNFSNCQSIQDWLERCPKKELSKQLSTFSKNLSIDDAKSTITKMDKVFYLNQKNCFSEALSNLNINEIEESELKLKYNASPKNIDILEKHIDLVKEIINEETTLLERLQEAKCTIKA